MELRANFGKITLALTLGTGQKTTTPPTGEENLKQVPLPSSGGDAPEYPNWITFFPFPPEEMQANAPDVLRLITVAMRCATLIANDVAALPVVFERRGRDGKWIAIERQKDNVVDVWEKANPVDTSMELMRDWIAHTISTGDGFLVMEKHLSIARPPDELWVLPSHLVDVVAGRRRVPQGYIFNRGGEQERIDADRMIHLRGFNPAFEPRGMGPLRGVESQVSAIRDMQRVVRAYFASGGRPGGVLSVKAPPGGAPMQPMTEPQRRELEASINRGTRSPDDWFKMKVAPLLEFTRSGSTLSEMNIPEVRATLYADVCLAFGVTPWMIGLKGGSSGSLGAEKSGSETDVGNYIERTLLPLVELVARVLTEKFCPHFALDTRCRIETSGLPHLVARRLDFLGKLRVAVGRPLLSVNEARMMVGLERSDEPEHDEIADEAPGLFGAPPAGDDTTDAPGTPEKTGPKSEPDDERIARAARIALRVRQHAVRLTQYERRMARLFKQRVFDPQERATIEALEAEQGRARTAGRRIDINRALDLDYEDEEAIQNILEELVLARGEEALAQVAAELDASLLRARASQFVKTQGARLVSQTTATTRRMLADTLADAEANNETFRQIVERVRDVFDNRRANAVTIARTETVRAYNAGARMAWDEVPEVSAYEWLTANDDVVREAHADVAGAVALKGEPFMMQDPDTGDMVAIEYPGDPNAPAWATINCRCTLDPVLDEEAERGKIEKAQTQRRSARWQSWWYNRDAAKQTVGS